MKCTDHIRDFAAEVEAHCAAQAYGPSTLTNRVLNSTYALKRMMAMAEALDDRQARLRAAMATAEVMGSQSSPPETMPIHMGVQQSITLDLPTPTLTCDLQSIGPQLAGFDSTHYAGWKLAAGHQISTLRAGWLKTGLPMKQPYIACILISDRSPDDADDRVKALLDLLVEMQVTPDGSHLLTYNCSRSGTLDPSRIVITVRSLTFQI